MFNNEESGYITSKNASQNYDTLVSETVILHSFWFKTKMKLTMWIPSVEKYQVWVRKRREMSTITYNVKHNKNTRHDKQLIINHWKTKKNKRMKEDEKQWAALIINVNDEENI